MQTTPPLWLSLANTALDELAKTAMADTDQPAFAVSALLAGAAAILNRQFGPELAAQLMVEAAMIAQEGVAASGLIAEVSLH